MRKYGCENFLVNLYKANYNHKSSDPIIKSSSNIQVVPNPSTGLLMVKSDNFGIVRIEIRDMRGQLILSHNGNSENNVYLDLSNHPSGVYIIKTQTSDNCIYSDKLILAK